MNSNSAESRQFLYKKVWLSWNIVSLDDKYYVYTQNWIRLSLLFAFFGLMRLLYLSPDTFSSENVIIATNMYSSPTLGGRTRVLSVNIQLTSFNKQNKRKPRCTKTKIHREKLQCLSLVCNLKRKSMILPFSGVEKDTFFLIFHFCQLHASRDKL